ncbi:ribonuclease Z [Flavobacterium agricola]|uniref:Ribonuclease Z n=1 Tax=Flavobacterium agricola TaxID=2870839 RepID=A0ABY6M2A2_9FLAO|nr:ribonuclease Z [Flavobacterium agricola]UYW01845.1 ribonuclease Z [Flavobacterium agricola]
MKVQPNENEYIISPEAESISQFLQQLEAAYSDFLSKNIIVDLTTAQPTLKEVELFQSIHDQHIANHKSFVIVVDGFDFNEATEGLNLVPTLQEAYDVIEIDEIQRDLGF